MLNKRLYAALKAVFGKVSIENEGIRARIERDYTTGYSTSWRLSDGADHGEQYRVNCPFCHNKNGQKDTKQHLYISYLSYARPTCDGQELASAGLLAHCFRANCVSNTDNRAQLEAMLYTGFCCVDSGEDYAVQAGVIGGADEPPTYTVSDSVSLAGIQTWVPDFHWCSEGTHPDIAEYLSQRGVTSAMIDRFGIGWGEVRTPRTSRLLNNGAPWVVVPVVQDGKLAGVQARCPDKFVGADAIRYWIHPGMRKRSVVYNIDSARRLGLAVVCEGVFDVFKVGSTGVCCFGHTPSTVQLSMLSTMDRGLIWLPDNENRADIDTFGEAAAIAAQWNAERRFPLGVHVVRLPAKDAGEMSRQDVWATILSSVPEPMAQYIVESVLTRL